MSFGAIYIGLSGLSAYSRGLQTVSNNVSNLNTSGFKTSDVTFSDLYGVGSNGGLDYGSTYSGSGHGVSINELNLNFAQGDLRQTDRDLDLSVDGNGFFVLQDGDNFAYTRTGSFSVNDEGFIVLGNTDYRLATLDGSNRPVSLNIDTVRTNPPSATTTITFSDNLSSTATEYTISDVSVFDASGTEHIWTLVFNREANASNEWTLNVTDATGREIGSQTINFEGGAVAASSQILEFEDTDNDLNVAFDFSSGVTSFSSGTVSSLRAAEVDGHATGSIATLAVNETGQLEITYTNEETLELGSIALADFRNPQQLEQRSNGLFVQNGSGQRQFLTSEDSRVGNILTRRLEASNVDLGAQFGNLILIQRGFQASSQVVSVSNDMIQQLFGIRGQG